MSRQKDPLRRQPQQKRSQERVEKILDAAAIVFNEVGFEKATTQTIAKKADTAIGSLYQFFPDKLAIFNALELRHVDRVYSIWEKLLSPEIVQLPFDDFIHMLIAQFQKLFEQPTSKIVFCQFFTSPAIFKNIDASFTQEAIQFTAKLFKTRNSRLTEERVLLLGEICVHGINTLILLALRSDSDRMLLIFHEIEILLKGYLKDDLGDEAINNDFDAIDRLADIHNLNSRQKLILHYSAKVERISIRNCEVMFPKTSRRTLQRDLKILVEHQLLLTQGHTDQKYYFFNSRKDNL